MADPFLGQSGMDGLYTDIANATLFNVRNLPQPLLDLPLPLLDVELPLLDLPLPLLDVALPLLDLPLPLSLPLP